jgi:hypothetical protein
MFTANEAVTAIATTTANTYMEDRYERSNFAAFLASEYGAGTETAPEMLACLAGTDVWYEDGVVTALYRDLMEFREQEARSAEANGR